MLDELYWRWITFVWMLRSLDFKVILLGLWNLPWLAYNDLWPYLFAPSRDYTEAPYFQTVMCRLSHHPRGVIWDNIGGLEPDMHCKTCHDDLG